MISKQIYIFTRLCRTIKHDNFLTKIKLTNAVRNISVTPVSNNKIDGSHSNLESGGKKEKSFLKKLKPEAYDIELPSPPKSFDKWVKDGEKKPETFKDLIKNQYEQEKKSLKDTWDSLEPSHPCKRAVFGLHPHTMDRPDYCPTFYDIIIIGGGVIGSSIAYFLAERAPRALEIAVIEKDPTYANCSTVLSVGGLRQQFSLPENIEMSMYSASFLRNIDRNLHVPGTDPPDVSFHPHGYLFLASEDGIETLHSNYKTQIMYGAHVEMLGPERLKQKFPWLNYDGIAGGCLGTENEGWFDPWSLLNAFKKKSIELGVHYIHGEVDSFNFQQRGGDAHLLDAGGEDMFLNHVNVKLAINDEIKTLQAAQFVNAAGPNSGNVAWKAGIGSRMGVLKVPLPVEPRKRYVFHVHAPEGPSLNCPLTIDPSGAYFRREGLAGHYICGMSPKPEEEPPVDNWDVDYKWFEERVWPTLANRIPSFEKLKIKSAWTGFYDYNCFDQNAVIGRHPFFDNFIMASGFSGHGIQQAPAVGRAVMELIIESGFQTIDLKRLGFERLLEFEQLFEENIV